MDVTLEIGRQQQHQQLEQEVANINKYKYKQQLPTPPTIHFRPHHHQQHQHHHHQQQSHHDNVPETTL